MNVPAESAARKPRRALTNVLVFAVLVTAGVVAWRMQQRPAPQVAVGFERQTAAGSEIVAADTPLVTGDRLSMTVLAGEPVHLYVVNEDPSGNLVALFPFTGLDRRNPLPAGEAVRLPGTLGGAPFSWEVTSIRGRESFLVIAARERLPDVEAALAQINPATPGSDAASDGLDALRQRLFGDEAPADVHVETVRLSHAAAPGG